MLFFTYENKPRETLFQVNSIALESTMQPNAKKNVASLECIQMKCVSNSNSSLKPRKKVLLSK